MFRTSNRWLFTTLMASAVTMVTMATAAPPAVAGPYKITYVGPYSSQQSCEDVRYSWGPGDPDSFTTDCLYYSSDPDNEYPNEGPGWYFKSYVNLQ